ncbi:hypothetical protein EV361DRAFT_873492 [Lentinula raphanica]|nr:hypothetical protein EV361DRAFT_873492 [Lentinula raphanica]
MANKCFSFFLIILFAACCVHSVVLPVKRAGNVRTSSAVTSGKSTPGVTVPHKTTKITATPHKTTSKSSHPTTSSSSKSTGTSSTPAATSSTSGKSSPSSRCPKLSRQERGNPEDTEPEDNEGSSHCDFDTVSTREVREIHGNETLHFADGEVVVVRLGSRNLAQMEFNCQRIPDVCNNMCHGLNCLQIKNQFTRQTNKATCKANRKRNQCGVNSGPNRCSSLYKGTDGLYSQKPAGVAKMSCDEFPFASTEEASKLSQPSNFSTRCVDASQNSSQGGQIAAAYKKLNDQSFEIVFNYGQGTQSSKDAPATATNMQYCQANPVCTKDTLQMT